MFCCHDKQCCHDEMVQHNANFVLLTGLDRSVEQSEELVRPVSARSDISSGNLANFKSLKGQKILPIINSSVVKILTLIMFSCSTWL